MSHEIVSPWRVDIGFKQFKRHRNLQQDISVSSARCKACASCDVVAAKLPHSF